MNIQWSVCSECSGKLANSNTCIFMFSNAMTNQVSEEGYIHYTFSLSCDCFINLPSYVLFINPLKYALSFLGFEKLFPI